MICPGCGCEMTLVGSIGMMLDTGVMYGLCVECTKAVHSGDTAAREKILQTVELSLGADEGTMQ